MNLEINKLIESEISEICKIGWLLYETEKVLPLHTVNEIIALLANLVDSEKEYIEREINKAWQEGYDEGKREAESLFY